MCVVDCMSLCELREFQKNNSGELEASGDSGESADG